jgi:poly(glycerol-phosphate) alpha-glucosyltransferase
VFEAVVAQASLIRSLGGEALIFALEDEDSARDRLRFDPSPVELAGVIGPRQIGFAPSLLSSLIAADLDCLHLHGIWMYPSRAGSLWAKQTGRPYFISPHGMLDPWITARGRWKKALARSGYERAGWTQATALHALTVREAKDIAREAGRRDSLVIPNAGPEAQALRGDVRPNDVIYIGRVHPKKNLSALVEGWMLAKRPDDAHLRIAGWGAEQDVADLCKAIASADPSVEFLGPVYGEAKQALLDSARFMILPSHSEGLPMAVLEAWAATTPVIMTAECNLPEGFAAGAALECGYDPAAIAAAIDQALALDLAGWQRMAQAGHALAIGPFSSAAIAARWGEAYGNVI